MSPELPDLLSTTHRRPLWQRALFVVGALFCFVLGIVGWLIPVVTGLPFHAAGLVLLGLASRRVARWINRLERRFPHRLRVLLRKWIRPAAAPPSGRAG